VGFWLAVGTSGLAWSAARHARADEPVAPRGAERAPAPAKSEGAKPIDNPNAPAYVDSNIDDKVVRAGKSAAKTTKNVAGEAGEAIGDGWLTSKVKTKLMADDGVKARRIDVDTLEGVVTLKGRVASAAERSRAVEIARGTDGVKQVVDELEVGAAPSAARTPPARSVR
jgi:hypothetical protein